MKTAYKSGELAYADIFPVGLIKCKVVKVSKDKYFFPSNKSVLLVFCKLTQDRGPYKRGEIVSVLPDYAVPRKHVFVRNYKYRVNTLFEWVEDDPE